MTEIALPEPSAKHAGSSRGCYPDERTCRRSSTGLRDRVASVGNGGYPGKSPEGWTLDQLHGHYVGSDNQCHIERRNEGPWSFRMECPNNSLEEGLTDPLSRI